MKNILRIGIMSLIASTSCLADTAETLQKVKHAVSKYSSYRVDELRADYVLSAIVADQGSMRRQLRKEFGACVESKTAIECLTYGCQVKKPNYTGEGEFAFVPVVTIDNIVEHIDRLCTNP